MSAPSGGDGGGGESAGGVSSSSLAPSSLPPPRPKSPPEYPDLYGKRREAARGEIKFIEGVQPASRCCKEVSDFVVANSDPLIPAQRKSRRSCRFWKWLCGPCLSLVTVLGPNAATGRAAQTFVVARDQAARAVHASEVAAVHVRTCLAAFPAVSATAVALDRRV
ncbi:unnamed protein product [Arabidopsis arenosa]|uniref:G protein gamma domain-containing protein n=1 Tax=Arabidopsis arenosa TaxID=38785 RepID=A0A8S2ALW6_ARAAE|nr:unnamed protein product [Arabidopsis arenosa]